MSVTAPVSKADGTKVVTARSAPVQARKAALAKSNTPQKSVKLQQTNAYKSVEQYWTPERLSHAKPAPFQSKMSKTSMQKATAKASKLLKNDVTRTSDKVSKANGKVFFRGADGGDYACSGSVVNSSSKRIVVTAGHCVHGGKGSAWHTNWVFVPNYSNDNKPQGTFHAQYLHTLHDWAVNGENGKGFNSDVGFVTTMDNEQGKHVADVVGGGHKLVTAKNAQFNATVFGYPGNIKTSRSATRIPSRIHWRGSTSTALTDATSVAEPPADRGSRTSTTRPVQEKSARSRPSAPRTTHRSSPDPTSTSESRTCSRPPTTISSRK